jgi:4-aminobutyrate aminotransferase-like enzyme
MTAPTDRDRVLDRYTMHVNKALASLARLVAAPVEVAAAGSKVQGSDGHTYLDCGGFGVFLLGHCHPAVVAAVRAQLERNPLATRLFLNPELAQAAADLAGITPAGLDYVFLTNSGAEATELGLKLARLAGKRHVIAMHGGFHSDEDRAGLAIELESAAAALEHVAAFAATADDNDALLARALYARFATERAIERAAMSAAATLGGMSFIESPEIAYLLGVTRALAFHPPSRAAAAGPMARYLAGGPLTL